MVLALIALGRGSVVAWGLLVLLNAIPVLAIGALFPSGGQILWVNVSVMVLTGIALEAVLLSRRMRHHLGIRRAPAQALARPPAS